MCLSINIRDSKNFLPSLTHLTDISGVSTRKSREAVWAYSFTNSTSVEVLLTAVSNSSRNWALR